jgi:hypothetical protein
MDLVLVDDSQQASCSRPDMGSLVAVGGYYLPDTSIRLLNLRLEGICSDFDFPAGEEFKWSPDRKSWMRKNLIEERRTIFFQQCLSAAREYGAQACICIDDTRHRTTDGMRHGHKLDVVKLSWSGSTTCSRALEMKRS